MKANGAVINPEWGSGAIVQPSPEGNERTRFGGGDPSCTESPQAGLEQHYPRLVVTALCFRSDGLRNALREL